jgi:hypothetical protein
MFNYFRFFCVLAAISLMGFFPAQCNPWPTINSIVPGIPQPGPHYSAFDYQNAPVNIVLDYYEQLSGKNLIRDTNLSNVPPVSINGTGMGKDDCLKLIAATLLLNGVALDRIDDHTMLAVTIGTNKNPRSEGLAIFTNVADLPGDAQIVSYFMPLKNITPQEAQGIFTLQSPPHLYGAYVPAPSANGIIITENVNVVRRLIDLQKLIDVPSVAKPLPEKVVACHRHIIVPIIFSVLIFVAGYFTASRRIRAAQPR